MPGNPTEIEGIVADGVAVPKATFRAHEDAGQIQIYADAAALRLVNATPQSVVFVLALRRLYRRDPDDATSEDDGVFVIIDGDGNRWVDATFSDVLGAAEHNLITNSHFQISQENGDAQGTADGYYAADEWRVDTIGAPAAAFTFERIAAPFASYPQIPYGLKLDVTTGSALAATQALTIHHIIEGTKLVGLLNWGTAGAKDLVIGFLCHTDMAGDPNFAVSVSNSGNARSYVHDFNVISDTDTWVTVTIPGDTSGTWLETNGVGLNIWITLDAGTNYQDTNDTWEAGLGLGTTATSLFGSTTGNTFWMGPMLAFPEGLPMPSDASSVHLYQRIHDRDLADCQRYFYQLNEADEANASIGAGFAANAAAAIFRWDFPTTMRAAPTVAGSPGTSDFAATYRVTGTADFEYSTAARINRKGCDITITGGTGLTQGDGLLGSLSDTGDGWLKADARL